VSQSRAVCNSYSCDDMKRTIEHANRVILDRFETAAGQEIPNFQELSVADYGDTAAQITRYKAKYRGAVSRTTIATGVYNCHGLVFGASRTGIHGRDVRMILHDDGYVPVSENDSLAGDVVLYVAQDGDVEHSAVLITPRARSASAFAVVHSKWGDLSEWVHDLPLCPYDFSNVEYWRINAMPRAA
jgi:hypothetical protein